MSEHFFWAALLVLTVAGWSWSTIAYARSQQTQANALMILDKIDERMDARTDRLVQRVLEKQNKAKPEVPSGRPEETRVPSSLEGIFGGMTPLVPIIEDQPDLEIESA